MDNKDNGRNLLWFLHRGIFILPLVSLSVSIILLLFAVVFTETIWTIVSSIIGSGLIAFLSSKIVQTIKKTEGRIESFQPSRPFSEESETFILPDFYSEEYPFDEQRDADRNIKWRKEAVSDISDILLEKDSVIIYGESGNGKSMILWQFLKYVEGKKSDIPHSLNSCIQRVKNACSVFCCQLHEGKLYGKKSSYSFLILDHIDDLSVSSLQDILQEAKRWQEANSQHNKLLICAKSSTLAKVCDAFLAVRKDMTDIGMYCLKSDDSLISRLEPGDTETNRFIKTETTEIMECLYEKMKAGELSLIGYQFANRLYRSGTMDEMFEGVQKDRLKDLENSKELITDIVVDYFNYKLRDVPCDAYMAYLSFLRILSDNRTHSIYGESNRITMFPAEHLVAFAENLVQEQLLIKIGRYYRTSHEEVGLMFQRATRVLLSGENVDILDTIRSGFDEYNDSIKNCYDGLQEPGPVNVSIILCSSATIIATVLKIIFLDRNYPSSILSIRELILWISADIAVYVGTLYMGNFYRYCANIVKSHRWWMYSFGVIAAMLPFFFLIRYPSSPGLGILGLLGFAVATFSIGVFYRRNSAGREINSRKWLLKKGRLFRMLGVLIAGLIVGLCFYVNALATHIPPEDSWLLYVCPIAIYLLYSVFIICAIKNYVHFQSLPVQRLRIAAKTQKPQDKK